MYRVNAPRISWGVYTKNRVCASIPGENGTPGGNRTHNGPLGGGCYIHLTTEAYETNDIPADFRRVSAETPKGVPSAECRFARANPQRPLRRGLLYPFNYGSVLNFIARGRNHCRKKFYTKIYTSFFPPRENKHKSSGFARKTCVLGNILWIEQYLRRGLLYPFNYGSI